MDGSEDKMKSCAQFSRGCHRERLVDSQNKLRACAQFVCVADEYGWLAAGDKIPDFAGLAPGH